MSRAGPDVPGASDSVAAARSLLSARGLCRQFREGFALEQATVELDVTLIFPKWLNQEKAPKRLQERWTKFFEAARVHEQGHREISSRAAEDLRTALAELPTSASCEEVNRNLADALKTVQKAMDRAQADYDDATSHGIKQGTVL